MRQLSGETRQPASVVAAAEILTARTRTLISPPPRQYSCYNLQSEGPHPQHAAHVGRFDVLSVGDVLDSLVVGGDLLVEQITPRSVTWLPQPEDFASQLRPLGRRQLNIVALPLKSLPTRMYPEKLARLRDTFHPHQPSIYPVAVELSGRRPRAVAATRRWRSGRAGHMDGKHFDPRKHFREWRERQDDWSARKDQRVAAAMNRARALRADSMT